MIELIRSNDPVLMSFARSVLDDAGIGTALFDHNMAFAEGSVGALMRRLLVLPEDEAAARRHLIDAGLAAELREAE